MCTCTYVDRGESAGRVREECNPVGAKKTCPRIFESFSSGGRSSNILNASGRRELTRARVRSSGHWAVRRLLRCQLSTNQGGKGWTRRGGGNEGIIAL